MVNQMTGDVNLHFPMSFLTNPYQRRRGRRLCFEGEQEGAGRIQTDKMGHPISTCHSRQEVAT